MADLRERVIKALRTAELWRDMDGIGTLGTYGAEEDDYAKLADAAIAAVLDALEEPSEGMRGAWASSGKHDDWRKECDIGWQAMLAAFREEQGI